MVEVKEGLGRFGFFSVGRAELPYYKFRNGTTVGFTPTTMKFIRFLRTPRCIIARRTANFSPYGINFRRMASFYNVDIAGLTDEQVEVREPLCEKTY